MMDHGFQSEHQRGNTGLGFRLGILDLLPFDDHEERMARIVNTVAPGVTVHWDAADSVDTAPLARLINAGCSVIAMPFVIAGGPYGLWPTACHVAASNGVLLFGATGNSAPTTGYPASDPTVFACGRVSAVDGSPIPIGSSATGRLNLGMLSGGAASSGASVMAACVSCLWLGYAAHRYPPSHRPAEFWAWLGRTAWPVPGRNGFVPDCRRLAE